MPVFSGKTPVQSPNPLKNKFFLETKSKYSKYGKARKLQTLVYAQVTEKDSTRICGPGVPRRHLGTQVGPLKGGSLLPVTRRNRVCYQALYFAVYLQQALQEARIPTLGWDVSGSFTENERFL